jgi:hypothetical protein
MMILMDKFKILKKLSSTIQNLIKVKETFLKLLIILKEEEEPINFGPKTNQTFEKSIYDQCIQLIFKNLIYLYKKIPNNIILLL